MPVFERSSNGDLFVEYNVVLPMEVSPDLRRSECQSLQSLITVPCDNISYAKTDITIHTFFRVSRGLPYVRTPEGRIIDAPL
jgi:hypothetical protein